LLVKHAKRKESRSDTRNARIVGTLIGSLTVGAALLLWLEPRGVSGRTGASLLMMENQTPIEDVTIDFASADERFDETQFDCILQPDRPATWHPTGTSIHVLLVGSGGDRLQESQAAELLRFLGLLSTERGLDLGRVRLSEESDWRHAPGLPLEARDLADLLVRKGFIR
jgi:hypothetical protein